MNLPSILSSLSIAAVILTTGLATVRLEAAAPTTTATVEIWPEGKMPGSGAKDSERDMPARTDGFKRITNISRPSLTFFPAPKASAPAPAVIICPGGGYSYVVFDKEGTEIAAWLNTNGTSALVLKYRTPNNRAGALQDLQRALSLKIGRAHV